LAKIIRVIEQFIEWLHSKLDKKQFLILSSILVGLTAGLAAVVLKMLVHFFHRIATADYDFYFKGALPVILPVAGILLTVFFVQKHLKGKLGRGNSNVLHSIAKKGSRLPADQMYSHVVTSALTVGFGGSVGLESPMVTTGAAIGSNYGRTYKLTYKDRTLLLACGAAAGIAAAFNAPIAGVLFALEVLLADVTISLFIPVMIASAAGAILSLVLMDETMRLEFHALQPFDYHNVGWYVVLGIIAGLVSVYYSRVFPRITGFFRKRKKFPWMNAVIGGTLLSLLIWCFPSLYGEGYESIKHLAELHPEKLLEHSLFGSVADKPLYVLAFVTVIMLIKVFAAGITVGSGGNGGNFAPSLFVGAYLGFVFSYGLYIFGVTTLPIANFTIVAMAGILTGIFHSPLTGIFLIAEITGGYELMIPLMIVSALSYVIVKYFEPFSMDVKALAKKGQIFTHDKDKNILSTMKVSRAIENDFQTVAPDETLGGLVQLVSKSKRNIFPVVGKEENLEGIILLDNIRDVMFRQELYDTISCSELMKQPAAVVHPDEPMYDVMKKFDETGAWNLPVIEDGKYVGFISKSSIFSGYRDKLIRNNPDQFT
jgi:CIC family chloride channel protein